MRKLDWGVNTGAKHESDRTADIHQDTAGQLTEAG